MIDGDKVTCRAYPNSVFTLVDYDGLTGNWLCKGPLGHGYSLHKSELTPILAGSETRITDPKTGGQKGSKLERYDLIPDDAMDEVARVYGTGAGKYAPRNWEKGYAWSLSIAALKRHISQFCQGNDYDTGPGGTNRHHMACAAWQCLCLLTFSLRGLGTDDRVKVAKKELEVRNYDPKSDPVVNGWEKCHEPTYAEDVHPEWK